MIVRHLLKSHQIVLIGTGQILHITKRTAREMYGTALPDIGKLLKAACRVVREGALIVLLLGNVNRQSVPSGLKRIGLIPISCVPSNEMRVIHLYYKLDTCDVSIYC